MANEKVAVEIYRLEIIDGVSDRLEVRVETPLNVHQRC